ncbi:UDP-N-acetylmuramoyl-tripeptide--D-alanyl-D-alanine ligase [Isoalcanivorax indicus]|uniref:UDP-N-acetylmuramoyl-tripeptide--D-alanyl-D- alanine ligase n=1 Tax=Isoalcanivorax indicus TaxID=2202653 RepID=UPI001FE39CFF|nr:UDP-N-acetylmuramoyl-tripeptide--D-alanyl-D-alanine ligase [Isoalcanivorax indicus]
MSAPFMLSDIATLTRGHRVGADRPVTRVSTDTRNLQEGDLFVALRGERFDAHDYLEQARLAGALAAVVERPTTAFADYVQVTDSRRALGELAAGWADRFALRRVAVTGNAGKTTVKEMIAVMLGEQTLATRGNLNNDIGVPLTLLSIDDQHRYGVFELGANAPGEIAWTSQLVKAQVGLITNVTGAHLEGFGTLQGIAEAKAELFAGMARGGTAIINLDDSFADFFAAQARQAGLQLLRTGQVEGADLLATDIQAGADQVRFTLSHAGEQWPVLVPLPGRHQVSNALQALAAALASGVSLAVAIQRLALLKPVPGRVNRMACGNGLLIDDSYNANPGSVRVAIELLAASPGPRMLVLGALAELGPQAADIHASLGQAAREAGIEKLVCYGALTAHTVAAFGVGAQQVDTHDAAAREAQSILDEGGTVLVKGSRSAGMDAVVASLRDGGRAMGGAH